MAKRPFTYADAGVDISEADRATEKIKRYAKATFDRNVLTGIGSFGACYSLAGRRLKKPVLISSADGVGTKLNVAFAMNQHHTVGQCLVNHCVNDIAVQGATPLFFMDYFATGKLDAAVTAEVVRGLSLACRQNATSLIGGETAEMPGMYAKGEYDLAGFIVGAAERGDLLDGKRPQVGSVLIGLASSGLHTNGYSLARKLLLEVAGYSVKTRVPELRTSVGKELLKVHRSYLRPLRSLAAAGLLEGAAHITGGGITDNTPRMLKKGLRARVRLGSWRVLPVFKHLQTLGDVAELEMLKTFNMGLGMIVCVPSAGANRALATLEKAGSKAVIVGAVEKGSGGVVYER